MVDINREQIQACLDGIVVNDTGATLGTMGWIGGLVIEGTRVTAALEIPPAQAKTLEPLCQTAKTALEKIPGVKQAVVVLTAQRPEGRKPGSDHLHGRTGMIDLSSIRRIIAVASGKGGVGKSTVAANLALALSRQGLKVALFDADLYGPSIPRMMGLAEAEPQVVNDRLQAFDAYGIEVMSIGFLIPEESPVVWRGPMAMGALERLLRDTDWGDRDIMVVDMPPGTGDTQLTISQKLPLAGAVIVSTPQDVALLDARKGLAMFDRMEVPILGVIENMSYYLCPACGHRADIFSHGGAKQTARALNVDFLGEIPLDIRIREASDSGTPIVAAEPEGVHARVFLSIAETLKAKLAVERARPRITLI